ncbi:FapA family protein [Deferribacter thermophilus]|uniref:DUF342 domain-containing protein n=1 Tax=Deferribacter thermophilus TaxID=53573 RepID=UPI003C24F9BF
MILKYLKVEKKEEFKEILEKVYNLKSHNYTIKEESDYLLAEINGEIVFDSKVNLEYLNNDLILKISLYPDLNGKSYTLNDILEILTEENIKDIYTERLKEAFELYNKRFVVRNITVAQGIHPIKGKDAKLILHFEEKMKKDKEDTQRKIDYKDISKIINVKKGELLITKIPATKGVPGVTVKGGVIPSEEGKDIEIVVLEGVEVLDNGRKYVASIDGYVVFENFKLAVYPVYTVKQVDYSTGNIDFVGTVHVIGDVLGDFAIKASKDIIIDGICEDAKLEAGENIIINQGVKGKLKNRMYAEKNFILRFAENAIIEAKGDIVIKNYALNCHLKSGGKIVAVENKGQIAGGVLESFNGVECLELGSVGSEKFNLIVGINPFFLKYIEEKERELDKYLINLNKIDDTLKKIDLSNKSVRNSEQVKKTLIIRKKILEKIDELKKDINEYKNKLFNKKAKIRVKGVVHSGLDIKICDAIYKVNEEVKEVLFFLEPKYNQVGWVSLEGLSEIDE